MCYSMHWPVVEPMCDQSPCLHISRLGWLAYSCGWGGLKKGQVLFINVTDPSAPLKSNQWWIVFYRCFTGGEKVICYRLTVCFRPENAEPKLHNCMQCTWWQGGCDAVQFTCQMQYAIYCYLQPWYLYSSKWLYALVPLGGQQVLKLQLNCLIFTPSGHPCEQALRKF